MNRLTATALAAVMFAGAALTARADVILDDFESYAADQKIGSATVGSPGPWAKAGTAITGDIVATGAADTPIAGDRSGKVSLIWKAGENRSGSARLYLSGDKPDLSDAEAVTVDARSNYGQTVSTIRLVVMRDGTWWETRPAYAVTLTDGVQTFSFDPRTSTTMNRIAFATGNAKELSYVLEAPDVIGLTLHSPGNLTSHAETITFDNFVVPEPAVAPAALGLMLLLRGRR